MLYEKSWVIEDGDSLITILLKNDGTLIVNETKHQIKLNKCDNRLGWEYFFKAGQHECSIQYIPLYKNRLFLSVDGD